jgi:hypothetical protein
MPVATENKREIDFGAQLKGIVNECDVLAA